MGNGVFNQFLGVAKIDHTSNKILSLMELLSSHVL